jgi:membrane-associated protease RseP (regulator of RpoE activity)
MESQKNSITSADLPSELSLGKSSDLQSDLPSPTLKSWIIFWVMFALTVGSTYLAGGWLFSLSLITILGCHEFGHYFASQKNKVRATLPFFIPAPPVFIAGTFGAFMHIKDPIPNRRVLLEIGVAGPIAGFIVAIPTLMIGLYLSEVSYVPVFLGVSYGSSIVLTLFSEWILGVNPVSPNINIHLHPMAFAGWIGMFLTGLNLLPIGQLDGGHIVYSLFNKKYRAIWMTFFICLWPLGWYWNGWWFWAGLIGLFGFKSAPVLDEELPLEKKHIVLGYIAVIIFILTFVPVPFDFF